MTLLNWLDRRERPDNNRRLMLNRRNFLLLLQPGGIFVNAVNIWLDSLYYKQKFRVNDCQIFTSIRVNCFRLQLDTRVDGWPLMNSPVPVLLLVGTYVYFVKSLGPRLMRDRAALPVSAISRFFNLVQAVGNLTLLYKFMAHGWLFRYSFTCQPVNNSTDDAEENIIVETCWWFLISKVAALLETVFLILLKRSDLITNFHLMDHILTPAFVWLGVRFVPGGHVTFFAALNSFVQYQNNTWWRRHVMGLKALQLAAVFVHSARLLVSEPCAGVPTEVVYALCGYSALLFTFLYNENEEELKRKFVPLVWITKVVDIVKNFIVTLTSACVMDQSALYDSPEQPLGHGEDEHSKQE